MRRRFVVDRGVQPWEHEVTAVFNSRFECRAERRSFGIVICVAGEVDLLTAPILESALDDQVNGNSQGGAVEVDLTEVAFLSARGISALVVTAKSAAQKEVDFRVTGCRPSVLRLLNIVGVAELLGLSPHP